MSKEKDFSNSVEPKAGEWGGGSETFEREAHELGITYDKGFLKQLSFFKERIKPKDNVVYYPFCSTFDGVAKAFPWSRVIHLDLEKNAVIALNKVGYEAHQGSAADFDPGVKVDILILMNPRPDLVKKPADLVQKGGYVFCNGYTGASTDIANLDKFKLVGIIREVPDKDDYQFKFESLNIQREILRKKISFLVEDTNSNDIFIYQKIDD